uniref:Zinc finger protein n=1 Tax=Ciona intestinalis TaxID=7719 RepID=Q1RPU5_CIOIN|nr:zinc finger protein [Ciona intestinalis]BAE93340.1 zinc finger protein [Ciona intestinalis]|eukprot:NP_001071934.1 zinc finger protein [Ciona intestinalis]
MKRSSSGSSIKPTVPENATPLQPTVLGSYREMNSDFICPICFNLIEEAYMTKCGHTFCYNCLKKSLEQSNKCTKCNSALSKTDEIYPNYLLNNLIQKKKKKMDEMLACSKRMKIDSRLWEWQSLLATEDDDIHLADIDQMLKLLQEKRRRLVQESAVAHNQVLLEFLFELKKQKQTALERARTELSVVETDISRVEEALERGVDKTLLDSVVPDDNDENIKKEQLVPKPHSSEPSTSSAAGSSSETSIETFNQLSQKSKDEESSLHRTVAKRRCRLHAHFDDLHECYYNTRLCEIAPVEERNVELLGDFSNKLRRFTQFSSIRAVASLSYASDILNQSSIVSSIDFDKDCDHFAVAGVTKKIKVYDYESVVNNVIDGVNCPIVQMACNSKISSISWSHYHKSWLASSDYEGSVILWDAFTGQKNKVFQEHEKRCWSVDFNSVDPRLLASGSDDARVKLWSTGVQRSVACIEAKANVCCVQFNPHSAFHLAFGCADHFVHYYDIRNTKQSVSVFRGHKKAVSYAKFVDKDEIVSASTDSELRLWKTSTSPCVRSFRGHTNDKNFVGLATNGDYIACGSENNSLYIYYKGLSKSLLTYKFNVVKSVLDREQTDDDSNEFVSAVAWRANSDIIAAANSQGTIKILELI